MVPCNELERGFLLSKDYANATTCAAGTVGADSTYTARGRLKTRTWARSYSSTNRIVTTYKYGFDDTLSGNHFPELTEVSYLDLRANGGGGCDHGAVFAQFLAPGARGRRFSGIGAPHPFAGPLVILVDAGTRSAGETLAAMFQEEGRALIIGDTSTAGMSSSKETLRVPSGLFSVYFSVRSNWQNANQGRGIEGIGISPQERLEYDPADLRRGVDTMVRLALERLRHGSLPIEYQPPKPK